MGGKLKLVLITGLAFFERFAALLRQGN